MTTLVAERGRDGRRMEWRREELLAVDGGSSEERDNGMARLVAGEPRWLRKRHSARVCW